MSLIQVTDLSFTYEGSYLPVFEHVSFQFDTAWRLGLTGRNGRGKTTFLRLLMGQYPYSGSITAQVAFEYFPYPVSRPEEFTIDVLREIAPEAEDWQLMRELGLLEVSDDALWRPFETLSLGERTKTLLAALFLKENAFLLIDEPTNHLDAASRERLAAYLRKKQGFLLVSHDRALLDGCVDHILAINRTNIELQRGNFSSWWQNKALQDRFELAENERLKADIRRLSASARRTSGWSDAVERSKLGGDSDGNKVDRGFVGHKSAKLMQRAKSIRQRQEQALSEKQSLLKNLERSDALAVTPLPYRARRLAELREVSVSYGSRTVCSGVTFSVNQGDRIALEGRNGCGKSSILKLLLGEDISHSGSVQLGSGLVVSCIRQDTGHLQGRLSAYARSYGIDESRFKAILRKLDLPREQLEADMSSFSGGQKKKVLVARSLCEQAHLYIWDEPLNFIDVLSRMQIEQLLLDCRPTLLFVEHDRRFCDAVATRRISLSP